MWMMILFLPLAYFIGRTIAVLPEKSRRVPVYVGVTFLLPVLLLVSIPIYESIYDSSVQSLNVLMLLFAALACYYLIRGASFIAIVSSFFGYGRERKVYFPLLLPLLAWILSLVEPVAVAALFGVSYLYEWPGKMDAHGFPETVVVLQMLFSVGVIFSILFLMWMYDQRSLVAEFVKEEAKLAKAKASTDGKLGGGSSAKHNAPRPSPLTSSKSGLSGPRPSPPPQFKKPAPPSPNSGGFPSKRFGQPPSDKS